jgi:hypothetical protein
MPGGTQLTFGVFFTGKLLGAIAFGAGPSGAFRLVEGANPDNCLTLTRLWLSDELPKNSESRVLGICLRCLKKCTSIKFLVTYADPSYGHLGTIYQATNWLYTGLSERTPLIQLGDEKPRHSRSLSHCYGMLSTDYFASHGIELRKVPQAGKHRYVIFLDKTYRNKLNVPFLPYPKKEN